MPSPRKYLYPPGTTVGRLTVIGDHLEKRPDGRNRRFIDVICECGEQRKVLPSNLGSGVSRSCGCLHKERASRANRVHGAKAGNATTELKRLLSVWRGMNQRCNNPNARNYKWYGGKGIKVEWPSFQDFYEWAVHSGYVPGLELDRIDPNKNYCSNNCMWSTKGDNITRAHLDIDKSVLQQATILAKDRECTLSKVIEEALVLFLNGTKEV